MLEKMRKKICMIAYDTLGKLLWQFYEKVREN
jgi:hypothetical protein